MGTVPWIPYFLCYETLSRSSSKCRLTTSCEKVNSIQENVSGIHIGAAVNNSVELPSWINSIHCWPAGKNQPQVFWKIQQWLQRAPNIHSFHWGDFSGSQLQWLEKRHRGTWLLIVWHLQLWMSLLHRVVTSEPFGSQLVLTQQHLLQGVTTLPTWVRVEEILALADHSSRRKTLQNQTIVLFPWTVPQPSTVLRLSSLAWGYTRACFSVFLPTSTYSLEEACSDQWRLACSSKWCAHLLIIIIKTTKTTFIKNE